MGARRQWISRFVAVLITVAVVAAACGDDGGDVASGQGAPTVDIVEVRADGTVATIDYRVDDDGASVLVSIDWGDGSPQEEFRAIGDLSGMHSYGEGVVDPLVTIVAIDDDGNTVRAGRTVVLGPPASTTSVPQESSSTSTSTTSTSSSTTSSTTTSTTTLPPEAFERVFVLSPADAEVVVDEDTGGPADGGVDGRSVELSAITEGTRGDAEEFSMRLVWQIRPDEFALLGAQPDVDVRFGGSLSVELDTGKNKGRAASFTADLSGESLTTPDPVAVGGAEIADPSIGPDDDYANSFSEAVGFSGPIDGSAALRVELEMSCSVEPGDNLFQVGEESRCDASGSPTITVTMTRTQEPTG